MGEFNWNAYNDAQADFSDREFVSTEEKKRLVETGEPFEVTHVTSRTFKKVGERWCLYIILKDGAKKTLTFGNPSFDRRDQLLAEMAEYLDGNGVEPLKVRLVMWGERAYGLADART